jgi:DNA-directed RNA polymerase specialized sigma24 family protein
VTRPDAIDEMDQLLPAVSRRGNSRDLPRAGLPAEEFAAVRQGLAKPNERDREIIRLVYLDEFSAPEIAVVLERPVNNLCVRLPRAMIQLKGILNDETHCA